MDTVSLRTVTCSAPSGTRNARMPCARHDRREDHQALRARSGLGEYLNGSDLYRDVRSCFERLREGGYQVGIAGTRPPVPVSSSAS